MDVSFIRGDNEKISSTPISDGQILFNTEQQTIEIDDADGRKSYGSVGVELTQAEYDELPDDKYTNGITYFITDVSNEKVSAENVVYDNSESQLPATNVQDAIDSLKDNLSTVNQNLGQVRTYVGEDGKLHFTDSTGADSVLPFSKGIYVGSISSPTTEEYSFVIAITRYYNGEYRDISISASGVSPIATIINDTGGAGSHYSRFLMKLFADVPVGTAFSSSHGTVLYAFK